MKAKKGPDWFLMGMVIAVVLAYLFPDPGAEGGFLHPELLTKAGVALIFFLNGLSLSFEALKAGTLRWPVHLVVQAGTFLLFPVLGFLFLALPLPGISDDLKLGFFYLCALPSTVSSSVAMTAAARGSVPVAVFNASLSSLIGVVLTPLWVSLAMKSGSHQALPFGKVILDLVEWLVLPLVIGQLCRPKLGDWAARNKKRIQTVDRLTILLLVYTSFCDSMKWGVWSKQGSLTLVVSLLGSGFLFVVVFAVMSAVCDALKFPIPDRIAAIFCGSKKSLASGVPMARLIFGSDPRLSLILLPIMLYHPLQLLICSVLASRWAERKEESGAPLSPIV
jgi:sodium/bile acid cotransporter 7